MIDLKGSIDSHKRTIAVPEARISELEAKIRNS